MEFERCYVYQPEEARPKKRRRTEAQGLHASWPARRRAYEIAWQQQHERIQSALNGIYTNAATEILAFLDESVEPLHDDRIPTGVILTGPGSASQTSLTEQLSAGLSQRGRRVYLNLESIAAGSLKNALKIIMQRATARSNSADQDDEDEADLPSKKGRRLLNYDFQILLDFVTDRNLNQVIIFLPDTEAFSNGVLSELIELMACWRDRIPFVLLLNVATSVDFVQQKLTKTATRSLKGQLFDAALSEQEIEAICSTITNPDTPLWLGPSTVGIALERQSDYIQDIGSFVDMLKYAYMSCYFANPLSLFLDPTLRFDDVPSDHFEALRNVPSLRSTAEQLLDDGDTKQVRIILESNQAVYKYARAHIKHGQTALATLVVALEVIRAVENGVPNVPVSSQNALYVQAMAGKLQASATLRSILLQMRKAPASNNLDILKAIIALPLSNDFRKQFKMYFTELGQLIKSTSDSAQPLRSEDDVGHSTVRTTVVAQKVQLSKQKAELSKQDAAYTQILRRCTDSLESLFASTLVNPRSLVFHEIFLYDLRSPHRETFTPRPRHAIERALSSPHDYLDCDCCASKSQGEDTLSASQPATAVLYQLYLESGSLINVHDMWQAFQAVMDSNTGEEQAKALFQRALADLRYLGMVKPTRKRADHIAKVAWKGL